MSWCPATCNCNSDPSSSSVPPPPTPPATSPSPDFFSPPPPPHIPSDLPLLVLLFEAQGVDYGNKKHFVVIEPPPYCMTYSRIIFGCFGLQRMNMYMYMYNVIMRIAHCAHVHVCISLVPRPIFRSGNKANVYVCTLYLQVL